jgi:cytochrome c
LPADSPDIDACVADLNWCEMQLKVAEKGK